MSLEEKVSALVDAISANTDALQHLAASIRGLGVDKVVQVPAAATGEKAVDKPVDKSKKETAKKLKETPPADPLSVAASTTTATPANAPAVASGSAAAEGTYADLQVLVPELAEKKGRSAAMSIFAELGFPNGKELAAKAPEMIPAAVAAFRKALA